MTIYAHQYQSKKKWDGVSAVEQKVATPREATRSLAEFAREMGVSAARLRGYKGTYPDFPTKRLQSGTTAYYAHRELKAWWVKHVAPL